MGVPQFLKTDSGEELVVLAKADYEALIAHPEDEHSEDIGVRELVAAYEAAPTAALPLAVWDAIDAGEHPVKAIRDARGLTQAQLAAALGLPQGEISKIERGVRKDLPLSRARAIAEVLKVGVDDLVSD